MKIIKLLAAALFFISTTVFSQTKVKSADAILKEAGLGNNQNISYVASADATAEYACLNGGENHPKAANKETVSGPVSAEGTFNSGQNGQITQSLTLQPPGPGDFTCPNGQTLVLASVSYVNVAITDTTNSITEAISGSFSQVFYTFE